MKRACFTNANFYENKCLQVPSDHIKKNHFRMNTYLLILCLVIIPVIGIAQSPVDKLFDKYSGKEGFTTVYISQYMFDMFKDAKTDDKDFDELVKNLKSIRILAVENPKAVPSGTNFYKEIMKVLPIEQYKELMVIKEKDQDIKFLVKENQGKISELLMIAGGKENVFICILGNIDMKSIAKLSKSLNIQGIKPLENFNDKGNKTSEPQK
jgi:ACT domain-containing protein